MESTKGEGLVGWLVPEVIRLVGRGDSQLGVILQDDLQFLTQHDVPPNLQLTSEERLAEQQRYTQDLFFCFFKESSSYWFVVFYYTESKIRPRCLRLTFHTDEKATSQVFGQVGM